MVVPPDTPTCRVKGIIRNIEFEDEYIDPSLEDENSSCPPGVMPGATRPAQYRLTILIQEVSFAGGSNHVETCEDRYVLDSEIELFIYKTEVVNRDSFEEGQVIDGQVWNSYFRSYTLIENPTAEN